MARSESPGDHLGPLGHVQALLRLQPPPQRDVGEVAIVDEALVVGGVHGDDRHGTIIPAATSGDTPLRRSLKLRAREGPS